MYFIELKKYLPNLTSQVCGNNNGWNIKCESGNKHQIKWRADNTGNFKINDDIELPISMELIPKIVEILSN